MFGSLVLAAALTAAVSATPVRVVKVDNPPARLRPLRFKTTGRTVPRRDGSVARQWPGTYFEAAFRGSAVFVRVGAGEADLRLRVDGGAPLPLTRPSPGLYRIAGLARGLHRVRIDVASETKAAPTMFGGFLIGPNTRARTIPRRRRAIEFIGDSQTVGYANLSRAARCSDDIVRDTTDTAQGIAPLTAARFDADYQIIAVSGRGVVRNYGGAIGDTLPALYPFTLFDKSSRALDPSWRPQVVAIALGTNDFSTPLREGERWPTRAALREDYEKSYVRFVDGLRRRYPGVYIVLWTTDFGDGEIVAEAGKVATLLAAQGNSRVGLVKVAGLGFAACNLHPDLGDDRKIADALAAYLARNVPEWRQPESTP